MRGKTCAAAFALTLALALLCSCTPFYNSYGGYGAGDDELDRNVSDTYLYNGYTGLEVVLPKGYYTTGYNEKNLTLSPGESATLEAMDMYDYMDGGCGIDLAGVQNTPAEGDPDLGQLQLYMEYYPGLRGFDEYMLMFMDYMQSDDGEFSYSLTDSGETEVNGGVYMMLSYELYFAGEYYVDEYYLTPVGGSSDCLYFVANIFYNPNSAKSRADAYFMLENCFSFSGVQIHGRPEAGEI